MTTLCPRRPALWTPPEVPTRQPQTFTWRHHGAALCDGSPTSPAAWHKVATGDPSVRVSRGAGRLPVCRRWRTAPLIAKWQAFAGAWMTTCLPRHMWAGASTSCTPRACRVWLCVCDHLTPPRTAYVCFIALWYSPPTAAPAAQPVEPSLLRQLLGRYGIVLYCLVYLGLSLECPTVLSFCFLLIVFVGLVFPDAVFRSYVQAVMAYNCVFGLVRYVYGVAQAVGGFAQEPLLDELGLRALHVGQFAWVSIYMPTISLCLVAAVWRCRGHGTSALFDRHPVLRNLSGMACAYLYDNNGTEHISLLLLLLSGISLTEGGPDLLHMPFAVLFTLAVLFPRLRGMWLWRCVVLYCEFFVLVTYWWHFSWMQDVTEVTSRVFGSVFRTTTHADGGVVGGVASVADPCADAASLRISLALPLALLLAAAFRLRVLDQTEQRLRDAETTDELWHDVMSSEATATSFWAQQALAAMRRVLDYRKSLGQRLSAARATVAWIIAVMFPWCLVAAAMWCVPCLLACLLSVA